MRASPVKMTPPRDGARGTVFTVVLDDLPDWLPAWCRDHLGHHAGRRAVPAAVDVRGGRSFTAEEQQIAWAADLWPAAHDIRWEALHGYPAISGKALWAQVAEGLRRANV